MLNKLLALAAFSATAVSAKKISPKMQKNLETMQRDGIKADSSFGRHLINKSRRVEQGDYAEKDISFISGYSIKFIGCNHVTQWANEEEQEQADEANDDENNDVALDAANGRIRSKGLVRFKLCPTDSCSNLVAAGCSSNYGEYVVDMYNFLETYIAWQMEEQEYKCQTYRSTCDKACYQDNSYTLTNCYTNCYKKYGVTAALCSKNNNNNNNNYNANADDYNGYSGYDAYAESGFNNDFDLEDYLQCGEYEINDENADEMAHYLGPYCESQGGDIKLGFFQDQYCTLPSTYQASYFEKMTGLEIPYTKTSLVSTSCMACEENENYDEAQNNQDYYNYDADGNRNYYVATQVNDMCGSLYMTSGKCEVMFDEDDVPYPEEGACTYIEGVKRLQNDGIIRSNQTTSSRPASIAIGVFTSMAVLLGGYVYYLKSKIQRSRVNLAGASTSLA